MKKSTQSVKNHENGRSEPKSPRLKAYQRLLNGWAAKYPAHGTSAAAPQPAPKTFTGPSAPKVSAAETVAPTEAPAAPVTPKRPAPAPGDVGSPPGREEGSQARDRSTLPAC